MTVVTIHQPNYLPWVGLFSKIREADCFIIYDTAQYTKSSLVNRNRIRTKTGWLYLTVPISRHFYGTKLHLVAMPDDRKWQNEHWQTIYANYARAPFFRKYKDYFGEIYKENWQYLWQMNEKILIFLLDCFEIKVKVLRASELGIDSSLTKTDSLIACLKSAGASTYLSGPSGRNYLETDQFSNNNIALKYVKFEHPIYSQRYPGFEPNMAAIDLLFNTGPQASDIIKMSGTIED